MKIAAFCLGWIVFLSAPEVRAQQTNAPNQSWDVLRQLPAGAKLQVERKVGKKVSGRMVSLSDTELVIERKGKTESFNRDEVKFVWQVDSPSRKKRAIFAAIGGGVGFFVGFMTAVVIVFSDNGSEAGAVAALVGVTGGGALAGYAMAGNGKRTLIYSAP